MGMAFYHYGIKIDLFIATFKKCFYYCFKASDASNVKLSTNILCTEHCPTIYSEA